MKLLVINGPNLNMLGIREPEIYGTLTYQELCTYIRNIGIEHNADITIFQSNHEGAIVDRIQEAYQNFDGIIINPAAYTHTSVAILDALKAVNIPTIEVHLSNPMEREDFRHISYVRQACIQTFCGEGIHSYQKAILAMIELLQKQQGK